MIQAIYNCIFISGSLQKIILKSLLMYSVFKLGTPRFGPHISPSPFLYKVESPFYKGNSCKYIITFALRVLENTIFSCYIHMTEEI